MPYKSKKDQKEASARHYKKNREKIIEKSSKRNKTRRNWNRKFLARVKQLFHCVDCGEQESFLLDFDHVKGEKVCNVSDMVGRAYSIKAIKNEIRKCEVRCANCHRRKHANEKNIKC
tara:strand:+ start:4560 stop:4910 length:351 start_codon:yes stop_codon:yes gene_type:complete